MSTEIACVIQFQVYQGELPPLAAPAKLTATSLAGGKIGLDWEAVAGAVSYQIYRQAPEEEVLTPLGERITKNLYLIDETQIDGSYRYAIASVRSD